MKSDLELLRAVQQLARLEHQTLIGEQVGTVGDTGSLKGAYLYFEIRKGGLAVDPAPWFSARTDSKIASTHRRWLWIHRRAPLQRAEPNLYTSGRHGAASDRPVRTPWSGEPP